MQEYTDPFITITPLGGLGEIGLNCQIWESAAGAVLVDCGLMFPEDNHLGIDVVIPQLDTIIQHKQNVLGIVLTHGHEDHIGALPWLVPHIKGVRIYGSALTLAFVAHKLREHGVLDWVELVPVRGETEGAVATPLRLGDFVFHFFPVCHSIPDGFALGVETPVGRIIHSGDFKIDDDPLDGPGTDMRLFTNFAGKDGVRLLLSDSTNIEREGHSTSEREVKNALHRVFTTAQGRIIITLFSSHIQRIQEVFDLARETGRTVVISGKSLANNIEMAQNLGFLRLPPTFWNAHNGVCEVMASPQAVFLVTGAQGEPLSALARMAMGEHKQLTVQKGDTVIMSSRMIPGNVRAISRLINNLYKLGAEVLYESSQGMHASGHGHKDELRTMLMAARPQIFVPVHGEYRHLVKHCRLAQECGVPEDATILLEDGMPLTLLAQGFRREPAVEAHCTLVDGKGVGDVGQSLLRERQILGDAGIVIVSLVLSTTMHSVLAGPEITSRGFVYDQQFSHILEDAKCLVLDRLEEMGFNDTGALQDGIRTSLRRFFRNVLDRDPIVVSLISTVDDA